MPKTAKDKLAVDGTAKLAAKSKASDKHEKKSLSIEEATVASPRASRKRAGEFFDFEDDREAGAAAESKPSTNDNAGKAKKPAKRAKTDSGEAAKSSKKKDAETTVAKQDKGDATADKGTTGQAKKPKAKKASAPKSDTGKTTDNDAAESGKATKSKKPKESKESTKAKTIAGKVETKGDEKTVDKDEATSSPKAATKKTNQKSKDASKASSTKDKGEKAADGAEPAPTKSKAASKKAAAGTKTKSTPIESDVAMDQAPFENLLGSDIGKTPVDTKDNAATAPKASKKKQEGGKAEKAPKDGAPVKAKKSAEPKEPKSDKPDTVVKHKDVVNVTFSPSETTKAKSKKRKAPALDEAVKSDVLDPLSEDASESASKKQKQSRKSIGKSVGELIASSFDAASGAVRSSLGGLGFGSGADGKSQTQDKSPATDESTAQPANDEASDGSDAEPDDQTAALLAGFESDSGGDDADAGPGFTKGQKLPGIPDSKKTAKKLKAIASSKSSSSQPGVVYVGRIPHGFYEHEMRDYFSQFGDISRLRLSRSRKTGQSKHYAFLEFANAEVAAIVAETMDNYLMFGHILKCKIIAPGDVHEGMWKGANKRFKQVPWNKLEGRKLALPAGRDQWKKREDKERARRASKAQKASEVLGYSYEGPELKSVDDLPVREGAPTTSVAVTQEPEKDLITASGETEEPVVTKEEVKASKGKKGKQGKAAKGSKAKGANKTDD